LRPAAGASRYFNLLEEEWTVPDRLVLRGGLVVSMDERHR